MTLDIQWDKTILAAFKDEVLKKALGKYATERKLYIYWGRKNMPNIVAIPCFIAVADPAMVGEDNWGIYLAFKEDENDPYIIVSREPEAVETNEYGNYSVFDLKEESTINKVIGTLGELISH